MKKIITSIALTAFIAVSVFAQESKSIKIKEKTSQIYIETDPLALPFNGFSAVIKRSSTFFNNLTVGVGVYRAVLPESFINEKANNVGKGWSVKNCGIESFFDYHLFDPNKGFTVGLTLSLYEFQLKRNGKEASYISLAETLRVGYLWRPVKKFQSFYVYPGIGLSPDQKIDGENTIDGESFDTPALSFVPSFQIGFSF